MIFTTSLAVAAACTFGLPQPDLSISLAIEPGDVETSAGENVSVDYTVTNSGSVDVEDATASFYLSTDATWDAGDAFLESESISVEAGEVEDESEQLTVPSGVAAGCYHLIAVIDPSNLVPESDETNNTSSADLAVDVGIASCTTELPDLVPSAPSLGAASVDVGGSVSASVTLSNLGNASGADCELFYFLSDDAVFDGYFDEVLLSFDEEDLLFPGESVGLAESLVIEPSTAPGSYTVFFVADAGEDLAELDESNNVVSLPLEVTHASVATYGEEFGAPNVGTLSTVDTPIAGGTMAIEVAGIPGGGAGLFFASLDRVEAPRFGGTILADLGSTIDRVPFDLGSGPATVIHSVPPAMSGTTVFCQAAARDASQSGRVALTHGLCYVVQ